MVTFLAGGTGTPKLLSTEERSSSSSRTKSDDTDDPVFARESVSVVGNTGDDVELGGLLVSPDLDTVLFDGGGVLDRETWWGIEGDTHDTDDELFRIADAADLEKGPRYLPESAQTAGREIARWRRFSGVAEFMTIGDRDRAVHVTRTSLIDEGHTLTEATRVLADAFDLDIDLLPMSDDPVATIIHTPEGEMHFQEYWVANRAEPRVEDVEFRGALQAEPTPEVRDALSDPVIVGPSNPVTSVGPIRALPGVDRALHRTPVVAVSPFVGEQAFSGPAPALMRGVGADPSTAGVADVYGFADAFVLDDEDDTELDRPVVQTDTAIDGPADAERVARACALALAAVGAPASGLGLASVDGPAALAGDDIDASALPVIPDGGVV
ncbi:2-phospho-L-lactate transferase [Halolamina salifodinae]|uniref:2-phospho-L-lactate transferase n=1 Tax=Halolamina salifodinae TaxID=1202767 RepID=A0A8T4GXK8_9EURY|nr:2-phospho-L-lactate transferase [Halolamina salifodinae]MBP1987709.1 LPPG:FO 2-phospho-L-lactate transferase [Halolamina salifodinae]